MRYGCPRLAARYLAYPHVKPNGRHLQVEGVACTKSGTTLVGTIHLTAHHLIFRYDAEAEKEMWVSVLSYEFLIRVYLPAGPISLDIAGLAPSSNVTRTMSSYFPHSDFRNLFFGF